MNIKLLLLLFSLAALSSCMKNEDMDLPMDMDDMEMSSEMQEENTSMYMGEFIADAHPTSGKAKADTSTKILSFTDFKSDDGPLLEVYLATDTQATEFISLGALKGLEGDYEYDLPENVDLVKYQYVLIWCVDFSVNFGYAKIEM
ncbi:DM13 domain-containing protein [Algoriphagus halophytocola]|uniref:DM13 domain-containing protein n=1 Tax=Algoriphagus halophytocola TaxID=2991499 RepID=A0ABY6MHF4_9BACT|nr:MULTISPECIES: DM13 domain-containing protein [unclassified Algoriphagus]UZD21609.1 DM13 domain-containing protein [Algoriphagus sp. TR-M5]WBL42821.1 DM13 domain-containing protein [Algoriphagus sp. TR-M9]